MQRATPELRSYDCADHDPIDAWVPDDDVVYYYLNLSVGILGRRGSDHYAVLICTPRGLSEAKSLGWQIGPAAPIVLPSYTWKQALEAVELRLSHCEAASVLAAQENLGKLFRWEFEGYR